MNILVTTQVRQGVQQSGTRDYLYQCGGAEAWDAPADAAQVRAYRASAARTDSREHAGLLEGRDFSTPDDQALGGRPWGELGRGAVADVRRRRDRAYPAVDERHRTRSSRTSSTVSSGIGPNQPTARNLENDGPDETRRRIRKARWRINWNVYAMDIGERRNAMNLERYTDKAQEALLAAHQQAQRAQNPDIEPEHLLRALVDQSTGVVPSILRRLSADLTVLLANVDRVLKGLPQVRGGADPGASPRLQAVAKLAEAEAARLRDEFVSAEAPPLGIV